MPALVGRLSAFARVPDRLRGQGLMEYGLIVSLISLFCIISLALFGQSFMSLLGNTGGLASYIRSP